MGRIRFFFYFINFGLIWLKLHLSLIHILYIVSRQGHCKIKPWSSWLQVVRGASNQSMENLHYSWAPRKVEDITCNKIVYSRLYRIYVNFVASEKLQSASLCPDAFVWWVHTHWVGNAIRKILSLIYDIMLIKLMFLSQLKLHAMENAT